MWSILTLLLAAHAEGKEDGPLPTFADLQPRISCCADLAIHRAIRDKREDIAACYTGGEGRGSLRWTVQPDGAVTDVSATTGDTERDACLVAALETLSFPELRCTLTVIYPVVFAAP